MKKRRITALVIMGVFAFSIIGCGNKGTAETSEVQESVQEDEEQKEVPEYIEIGVETATQLIKEKIGDGYTIEYTGTVENDSASVEQEELLKSKYYIFSVSKDKEPLVKELAVQVISGEIYSYDVEAGVQDYSNFPLYDKEKDSVISWEGKYDNEKCSINLMPGDSNSFEFTINNAKGDEIITAVAITEGNKATFTNEGYELVFEISGDKLTIKETPTDKVKYDISGEYNKK